ncbi:MAG: multiheme c-type cytochrome [Planctomycetota bacterium]|jgi:nitrate/TMAO reductase-like tetraheme cytochrome c subunit
MRPAALLSLVVALLGLGFLVRLAWPSGGDGDLVLRSASQCLDCHSGVAAEWDASQHRNAFLNPEVRKLSNDFQNQECIACHAPRPVLSFEPGERVLARQSERALGVDCLTCHLTPEGGVAASSPNFDPEAPCRPQHVPRMASVDLCASCHNQHGTVDQWRAAPPELKRNNCNDCHMPVAWREGGVKGRAHLFHGGHDLATLQAAVTLDAGFDAEGPWVTLTNDGAGHNFPTDERSRAADLQVRWQGEDGSWGEWQHIYRFRDPYRDETDLTNTQLPSGETARFPLADTRSGDSGEVRLLYRTNPFMPDDEAREVARMPLTP